MSARGRDLLRPPRCVSTGPVVVRLAGMANKRERESNAKGPFTWLRRLPVPSGDPCDTPFFAFQLPDHFPVALALDLLLLPPTQGVGNITRCTACATVTQPLGHPLVGPGDRHDGHFVPCPHTAFDSTLLATTPMSPQATCLYVTMYVLCLCVRHGPHACLARWLHGFRPGVDPGCGDSEV